MRLSFSALAEAQHRLKRKISRFERSPPVLEGAEVLPDDFHYAAEALRELKGLEHLYRFLDIKSISLTWLAIPRVCRNAPSRSQLLGSYLAVRELRLAAKNFLEEKIRQEHVKDIPAAVDYMKDIEYFFREIEYLMKNLKITSMHLEGHVITFPPDGIRSYLKHVLHISEMTHEYKLKNAEASDSNEDSEHTSSPEPMPNAQLVGGLLKPEGE